MISKRDRCSNTECDALALPRLPFCVMCWKKVPTKLKLALHDSVGSMQKRLILMAIDAIENPPPPSENPTPEEIGFWISECEIAAAGGPQSGPDFTATEIRWLKEIRAVFEENLGTDTPLSAAQLTKLRTLFARS